MHSIGEFKTTALRKYYFQTQLIFYLCLLPAFSGETWAQVVLADASLTANSLSRFHKVTYIANTTSKHFKDFDQQVSDLLFHIKLAAKKQESLYLRNESAGIWKKAWRGELLVGELKWPELFVLLSCRKIFRGGMVTGQTMLLLHYKSAFTTLPVKDDDRWTINYLGHPYAGSYYYNSLRSQNATWLQSFAFATAQSFIWEYIIEATAEQPSIQDLIITPVVGSALGEPIHKATLAMRKRDSHFLKRLSLSYKTLPMF
jgi:hypothetical protein